MSDRLKFFSYYTIMTLLVILGLYIAVNFFWYPHIYFELLSVSNILLLICIALVIVGPLLALFAYKAEFKKDFMVILLLQSIVIFFGAKLLYEERPVFLVFSVDRFVIVTANSIHYNMLSPLVFSQSLDKEPLVVAAHLPKEADIQVMIGVMNGEADIEYRPELYEPLVNQLDELKDRAKRKDTIKDMEKYLDREKYFLFPLVNPKGEDKLIVFGLYEMDIVDVYDIDPWEIK